MPGYFQTQALDHFDGMLAQIAPTASSLTNVIAAMGKASHWRKAGWEKLQVSDPSRPSFEGSYIQLGLECIGVCLGALPFMDPAKDLKAHRGPPNSDCHL